MPLTRYSINILQMVFAIWVHQKTQRQTPIQLQALDALQILTKVASFSSIDCRSLSKGTVMECVLDGGILVLNVQVYSFLYIVVYSIHIGFYKTKTCNIACVYMGSVHG